MKNIFLYEWATGGGLVSQTSPPPASLLTEGTAMLQAICADFLALPEVQVTTLHDIRNPLKLPPGVNQIKVHSAAEHDELLRTLSAKAEATILIAPEFDQILLKTARLVEQSGGVLLSPSSDVIKIAADKNKTAQLLAVAGLPVLEAVTVEPGEPFPQSFKYPAVLKPLDGAGSQNLQWVASATDRLTPVSHARRLERFCAGLAVSCSVLCGFEQKLALVPCTQDLSKEELFYYRGGSLPLAPGLAHRAQTLALRAVETLPKPVGYLGVDLLLGDCPAGTEDYVLEINPRLTTSYIGLRRYIKENLAALMLSLNAYPNPLQKVSNTQTRPTPSTILKHTQPKVSSSQASVTKLPELTFSTQERPLRFTAAGAVYFSDQKSL